MPSQPDSPAAIQHWGRYYGALYRQTQRYMREVYARFGLTYTEGVALVYIADNPGAIQDQIAHHLSLDKATTTKTLKRLEAEGFITRVVDESNQRMKRVHPLPKAQPCQEVAARAIAAFNGRILSALEPQNREAFLRNLQLVSDQAISIDCAQLAQQLD